LEAARAGYAGPLGNAIQSNARRRTVRTTRVHDGVGAGSPASAELATGLREITERDGRRLVRIVLFGGDSVAVWRRAQIVTLAAQGMSPAQIGEVTAADPRTVCAVIENFNRDGFDSLDPYRLGGGSWIFGAAEQGS
jgi:hypothetical protein